MRRTNRGLPFLLAVLWLLSLFFPVLAAGRLLANRDVATLHLPLRTSFRELAASGLPVWNPWSHGGQPILSNPIYGSFYPPNWLVLPLPPAQALTALAVLHAAIGLAGAFFLARRLGCGRGTAMLAGVAFAGSGAFLSLLSAFNLYCGIVWLPWVLAWGDEALRASPGAPWRRPAILGGGALGLAVLGDPVTAMMSALGLAALATARAFRQPASGARALALLAIAGGLGAVQILPTLDRLADSPRRHQTIASSADWSLPPLRLVEPVLPRLFGDPARKAEGLFFGWSVNDGHYPLVESLYPGLLLSVLGLWALGSGGIPRRGAWLLAFGASWYLALGRHSIGSAWLWPALPPLAVVRFPEKFAVLALFVLGLAGVLGWQRLLTERRSGRPEAARLALALAAAVLALAVSVALLLQFAPTRAAGFIAANSDPMLRGLAPTAGLPYLRGASWWTAATAAAVAGLLALCRFSRLREPWLHALALLLLTTDLWSQGHRLVRSAPAAILEAPPEIVAGLLPAKSRIYVQSPGLDALDLVSARGGPDTARLRNQVATLQDYAGQLWRIPGVFEPDFELMLTRWGQRAQDQFQAEWPLPQRGYRYLGLWNVGDALVRRTLAEQQADLRLPNALEEAGSLALRHVVNPFVLPPFHFVPRVTIHATWAEARDAAQTVEWKVAQDEQCAGGTARTITYAQPPRTLALDDRAGRIRLDYRAEEGGFLVAAQTFDRGWRATLDEETPLEVHPTAACQLGIALPAGTHSLLLEYHERLLGIGAAITLLTLLACAGVLFLPRRTLAERT